MWEDHQLPAFVKFTLVTIKHLVHKQFLCDNFCVTINIFHLLVQEIWTITVIFYVTTVFAEELAY